MQAHKGVGDHSMDNLFEDGNFLCKKVCERPLIQGSFSIPVISFELTISGLGAEFLRKVKNPKNGKQNHKFHNCEGHKLLRKKVWT